MNSTVIATRIPPVGPETVKITITMSLEDAGAILALTSIIGGPSCDSARGVFEGIRKELLRLKVKERRSSIESVDNRYVYFRPLKVLSS